MITQLDVQILTIKWVTVWPLYKINFKLIEYEINLNNSKWNCDCVDYAEYVIKEL